MRARGVQPLPCIAPTASVEMALPRTGLRGPQSPARLMRIAYLDCFSGISGDMFLGALIDAGVPPEVFLTTVRALDLGATLEINRVNRSGTSATKVEVVVGGSKEQPRGWTKDQPDNRHPSAQSHSQPHSHSHAHTNDSPAHEHHEQAYAPFEHFHTHSSGHGRTLGEIRHIIDQLKSSQSAKRVAISVFEKLGTAEAKIHNVPIEKIHFHEVGAVDAIVDIVCAAVGAEALGVDQFICSPLNVGGGTVVCAHGTFPVPAPATVEILKNAPVYSGEIQKELVTPTGAAIVSVLASRFSQFPAMKTEKIGYGAGTRNFKNAPNVLRLIIGETTVAQQESPFPVEEITVLEANVDDMTPQVFGYVMEQALQNGALDAFGTPVQMKKSRPGMLLTVLCRTEDSQCLTKLILAETTTLGVRMRRESRAALTRRHVSVTTKWGDVRMKLANLNGSISNYAPEYEDCRQIAKEKKVPLKTVMQEAIKVYLEETNG